MKEQEKGYGILESIADGLGRGLVYIKEDGIIGAYSKLAKEITGIRLPESQGHPAGRIEEGDIVIIADNDLGNDDNLSAADLKLLNIKDKSKS